MEFRQSTKMEQQKRIINKGKCKKCGGEYGYVGVDFGLCIKCLDKLENE